MKFGKAKTALLATCLSLAGCGSLVPEFPEVWQCQINGKPPKFFCVNSKTKEHKLIPIDSDAMHAGQCLSADDYKKSEAWVQAVVAIAEKRCK